MPKNTVQNRGLVVERKKTFKISRNVDCISVPLRMANVVWRIAAGCMAKTRRNQAQGSPGDWKSRYEF